jgi:hypothetical protein
MPKELMRSVQPSELTLLYGRYVQVMPIKACDINQHVAACLEILVGHHHRIHRVL